MSQTHYRPEGTATRPSGSTTLTVTRDALQDVGLILDEVCQGLAPEVDAALLLAKVRANVYDGLSEEEYWQAMVMAARSCIEAEPAYTFVAARLLLLSLYKEVLAPESDEYVSLADAAQR